MPDAQVPSSVGNPGPSPAPDLPSPLLYSTAWIRRGPRTVLLYPWHKKPDPRPDLERISEGYAADSVEAWFPIDDHHWYFTRDDLGRLFQETTGIRGDLYLRKTTELRRWLAQALDEGEVRAYWWAEPEFTFHSSTAAETVPAALIAPKPVAIEETPNEKPAKPSDKDKDIPDFLKFPDDTDLEPGAIPGSPIENTPHPAVAPPGWKPIPDEKTETFAGEPKPVVIEAGRHVYRMVGRSENFGTNLYAGEFWSLDPPASTEAEWRSGSAVLGKWNGDGGYIDHILTEDLHAWVGPAGPQNSQVKGHILAGGTVQIWVPNGTIDPLAGGASKVSCTHPSPWNKGKVS